MLRHALVEEEPHGVVFAPSEVEEAPWHTPLAPLPQAEAPLNSCHLILNKNK